MQQVTGVPSDGCAWWSFHHPLVAEVSRLYRACRTDNGATPALVLPLDPPHVAWEGLLLYVQSINRAAADEAQRRREAQERNRHG